jgi:hypothetical protein
MITIKGVEVPTQITDFNIGQFETATKILNDEKVTYVERYIDLLEAFKLPSEFIDNLSDDELFEIIKSFQKKSEDIPLGLKRTIEIDGYVYATFEEGGEFNIKAKDLSLIEKAFSDKSTFFSAVLAVIFKREDLRTVEHYTPAHLKHKANLFKELPAVDFYQYIVWITKKLSEKIKSLNVDTEPSTEQLESNND